MRGRFIGLSAGGGFRPGVYAGLVERVRSPDLCALRTCRRPFTGVLAVRALADCVVQERV